jgi:16S rRNA (guanine(1405)-N(7))-methyltransferase
MQDDPLDSLIQELRSSSKYQALNLPESTVHDLLVKELSHQRTTKEALKEVRKKLHNIVALYLGDPDYPQVFTELKAAFQSGDAQVIKAACTHILNSHVSTRERIDLVDEFYARLFAITGQPHTILDLACGLNPFTFPWMGLPKDINYYAYDIHQPRVTLINQFFELAGLPQLAIKQDVLVDPPQIEADVAFLFKEAHRFEQRQKGCNRPLWEALNVRYLLVSLPPQSLSGHYNLVERQRQLVRSTLKNLPWKVEEILFKNEMVFIIDKA